MGPKMIRCEGSLNRPAGVQATTSSAQLGPRIDSGICAMCGMVHTVSQGVVVEHDRIDILAELDDV